MTDLIKNVLGSGRSVLVGWIMPVLVTLELAQVLLVHGNSPVADVLSDSAVQLQTVAAAVLIALVVAAAQTPLYRVLEGYLFWPSGLAEAGKHRHRRRRATLVEAQRRAALEGEELQSGLLYEKVSRYPVNDAQFAPTALGNAIRRLETYAMDRYKMDSQLLWQHLMACAPESAVKAVDESRTGVDFFVCLLYGGVALALGGVGCLGLQEATLRPLLAVAIGCGFLVASWFLAVVATDAWDSAVRAMVDLGRPGVALAFGLAIPDSLEDERLLWRTVNTLVRRPYEYSQDRGVPRNIERFRRRENPDAD